MCKILVTLCCSDSEKTVLSSTISNCSVETPHDLWDVKKELAKISATCLTRSEIKEAMISLRQYNDVFKEVFKWNNLHLPKAALKIGLEELRTVLGFEPLSSLKKTLERIRPSDLGYHWPVYWKPSDEEIQLAETVDKYYYLLEQRLLFKKELFDTFENVPSAVQFLDWRFPAIRGIYRQKFQETVGNFKDIDRKLIDYFIASFMEEKTITSDLREAIDSLVSNNKYGYCA